MTPKLLTLLLTLILSILTPVYASTQLIIEPDQGRQPILQAIQNAKTQVDLAMYGFTDPDLMQAFIQAKTQGKAVRILLQHFPYKATDENQLAIQRFSASQVNLAYAPPSFYLLHQKTLVLDQHKALVLTFNFTRSTFDKERNFGLVIDDPASVQEIQQVFNADWQNKKISPHNPHLIWSPDNSREKMLGMIGGAKSEIKVYAQGLSDYDMVGALASAARRGVHVQVLTSGTEPGRKWTYMKKAGVQFAMGKPLIIHAKVIIVDQQKAMLGSINFTQPSIDKNRELSVLIDNPQVIQKLLQVYASDWQAAA